MELRLSCRYVLLASCATAMAVYCMLTFQFDLLQLCVVSVLLVISSALWDMGLRLKPAKSHTATSLITQYIVYQLMKVLGWYSGRLFKRECRDTKTTQENILRRILTVNANTVYGRECCFGDIQHREQFSSRIPLTSYAEVKGYIDRIERGEVNVLTSDPVTYLSMTSGTSGKCKFLPVTLYIKNYIKKMSLTMHYGIWKKLGTSRAFSLGRYAFLTHMTEPRVAHCGVEQGPITNYLTKKLPYFLTPLHVLKMTEHQLALHCHAVVMLSDGQLTAIKAPMSPLVLSFWIYVCNHWTLICRDIANGCISLEAKSEGNKINLKKFNKTLVANPARSELLLQLYNGESWNKGIGIAKRIWPDFEYIAMITTGAMQHSSDVLRTTYMKGIDQLSMFHTSSEGVIGINRELQVDSQLYTLAIDYGFFEFIAEEDMDSSNPKTLYAEQLEVGESYEVVITSEMGMCRYRLADVIEIVKKSGDCPVYKFKFRQGQILNLYWEKLPQNLLYDVIVSSLKAIGQTLEEYTSCEDCFLRDYIEYNSELRRYILFIELTSVDYRLTEDDKLKIDDELTLKYEIYNMFKVNKMASPIKVFQVEKNTFSKLRQFNNVDIHCQYKPMRRLHNSGQLSFLLEHQVK